LNVITDANRIIFLGYQAVYLYMFSINDKTKENKFPRCDVYSPFALGLDHVSRGT